MRYPSEESRGSRGVERHLCEAARSLPTPRNNTKKRQLKAKSSNYIPTEPARDAGHWCLSRQDLPRALRYRGQQPKSSFSARKNWRKARNWKNWRKAGGGQPGSGLPTEHGRPRGSPGATPPASRREGTAAAGAHGGEQPVAKRGHRAAIVIG